MRNEQEKLANTLSHIKINLTISAKLVQTILFHEKGFGKTAQKTATLNNKNVPATQHKTSSTVNTNSMHPV